MASVPDAQRKTYVLIPGRHHVLTGFQFDYLRALLDAGSATDVDGEQVLFADEVTAVWAVTSANHGSTRRNPVAGHRREAAIELFHADLGVEGMTFLIDDLPTTPRFADHILKDIEVQSNGQTRMTPANCAVATSTPTVIEMFEELGFRVLPLELAGRDTDAYRAPRAWDVLLRIVAAGSQWRSDPDYCALAHHSTRRVFERYGLGDQIVAVHADPVVGDEGDLTDTRDYQTYVRSFEEGASRKYALARDLVQPGRIVDVGCATGAILKLMAEDDRLRESDLYGIEVARPLYEICQHRKSLGEFANANTFFYHRNVLRTDLFAPHSVHTTTTFSLTHEIESYAGHEALLEFLHRIFRHTAPGGVFINYDVTGPDEREREVLLCLSDTDGGADDGRVLDHDDTEGVCRYVEGLSTWGRFERFARDFRAAEGESFDWEPAEVEGCRAARLRLVDAMEFLSKKDYTDNWLSEMHERFCFFSYADWQRALQDVGFRIVPGSQALRNDWIVEHRLRPVARLIDADDPSVALDWPVTNVLIAGTRDRL